jgi:hypothetical protein
VKSKRRSQTDAGVMPLILGNEPRFLWEGVAAGREDDHPVDRAVSKIPAVANLQRKLRRFYRRLEGAGLDPVLRIELQDRELEYRSLRENFYFDAGYVFGLSSGRADCRLSPGARRLALKLRSAALLAELSPADTIAALLETTRALTARIPGKRTRK